MVQIFGMVRCRRSANAGLMPEAYTYLVLEGFSFGFGKRVES